MNAYQTQLFNDLVSLTANTETFFKQAFEQDGKTYWIFNYRLSSYTEFLRPNALECRGHMFEVDATGQAVRLASLPMSKFFNINENPMTMNLDLSVVESVQHKRDGSLISTYLHDGKLFMKSKGSLSSDQALAAMKWIRSPAHQAFHDALLKAAEDGLTVNLEWTAPDNRIVLGYVNPALTVLNARNHEDGSYIDINKKWPEFAEYLVEEVSPADPESFINSIPGMLEDIEGFVIKLPNGLWFKSKTEKYCSLHHAKDSVNNPRRLFECILDEGVDDLLSMFATDELAVALITAMQDRVVKLYNHTVAYVEKFHEDNKHLDRKDFAIKGRAEVDPQMYFGLVMNAYLGKPNDYKTFLKSKFKEFGFKDETVAAE